mmetsp:Transcript_30515/g.79112  ORF Transcript_30515/g.79112 Transcript_30515/m.79112 type:complete len:127 (+) Transcript_30515:1268-1648(+)
MRVRISKLLYTDDACLLLLVPPPDCMLSPSVDARMCAPIRDPPPLLLVDAVVLPPPPYSDGHDSDERCGSRLSSLPLIAFAPLSLLLSLPLFLFAVCYFYANYASHFLFFLFSFFSSAAAMQIMCG